MNRRLTINRVLTFFDYLIINQSIILVNSNRNDRSLISELRWSMTPNSPPRLLKVNDVKLLKEEMSNYGEFDQ